jgi:succinoglycan biosynthesis protein ExoA
VTDGSSALAASTSISVIVPCRNEADFIGQLLDAISSQDLPPSEVVVVDNGSTDDTPRILEAYRATRPALPLRVLTCARQGAAAAMNTGIRAATGDIVVRLDGHSQPSSDYIRRSVERLRDDKAGVVGGVWEIAPGAHTTKARAIALAVGSWLGSGGAAYRHSDSNTRIADVDTVPFGVFRRSLWEKLGGYDDTLQVVEDGDFNYRVRKAGYRIILDPAIRCTYFPRRRMRTLGRQYLRYGWWKVPMLLKHPGAIRLRQLIPLGFVTTVLALGFASAFSGLAKVTLLVVLALYGAALLGSAFAVAKRARDLTLWLPVAAAFAVVHFAWGLGGLTHLITFGRWPPWRLPPAVQCA